MMFFSTSFSTSIRSSAFWLAALLLLVSGLAVAGPVECGAKPIRLAFYEFGYFYFEKDKQPTGIDRDIVEELKKRSGCAFDTRVMARARIWADLASGDMDMSVSGIQNAERDKFAWFANYLTMKNYAIVAKHVAIKVRRGDDFVAMPSLKFGAVRAFKHGVDQDRWLDSLRAQKRVEESADVQTLFHKLKDRRIDALYAQPPVYRKLIQDLDMHKDVQVLDWTPSEKGVPHALILAKSRFSEANAAQWRTLIAEMRADGTLLRIYSRYLPSAEAVRLLDF